MNRIKQLFNHAAIGIAGGFVLFVAVFAVSMITAKSIGKQWIVDCLLESLFAFAAMISLLTLLFKNKSLLGALIRFLAMMVSHLIFLLSARRFFIRRIRICRNRR